MGVPGSPPTSMAIPGAGGRQSERGAVSAEAAVVLPVLVAVAIALVWLVSLAGAQIRVVDAAREAARSAARGDPTSTALAAGRRVAPAGAVLVIDQGADQVRVSVAAEVQGPGGLFGFLPGVTVRSEALAVREPR